MIKFLDMKEKLNSQKPSAFCMFGNDAWVKKRALDNLVSIYQVDKQFGFDTLVNPTMDDLQLACLTPSMFCPIKMVVCEDFKAFLAKPTMEQKRKKTDVRSQLQKLVASANGEFCLVIVADDKSPFEGINGMEMLDCSKLDTQSVARWIVSFAKRQNVQIDGACATRIANYCLNDMARISTETQKLIDYGTVTLETVDLLVHKDVEYAVFHLSGSIASKNAQQAIGLYKGLVAQGEDPRGLFALLYNFYRRAYYAKTSAFSAEELAKYLSVKTSAIGFAKEIAGKYKAMQLKRALDLFGNADKKLKAFLDEDQIMTTLIMQLVAL